MKKGITKTKICISLDNNLYRMLKQECQQNDSKISTKINSIVSRYLNKGLDKHKKEGNDAKPY
jgi:hypothetical protein